MKLFKLSSKCGIVGGMKNFLSSTERGTLKSMHRKEPNRRVADRFKAILLSDKGRTYRRVAEADSVRQKVFIEFYEDLLTTTPEDEFILFGDGAHPTMATKIVYGWIKTSYEKPIKTTDLMTRVNLMGPLNLESMGVTIGQHETIDSAAMKKFFDQLKIDYPSPTTIHLILDQGLYNKSIATKKSVKERGIKIHYPPLYSPNLNPIERL